MRANPQSKGPHRAGARLETEKGLALAGRARLRCAGEFLKNRPLYVFLVVYAIALACLLSRLPLWTDELLTLYAARSPNPAAVLSQIRGLVGTAPLAELLQWGSFKLFGVSAAAGRLPSAIASLLACAGVFSLARQASLTRPILTVAVFAVFPLQLRYALEARGYALALCFTVWASVALLHASKDPAHALRAFGLYALAMAAAVYSHPYAIFVAGAHWVWAVRGYSTGKAGSKMLWRLTAAILAALVCFLPWYSYTSPWWSQLLPKAVQGAYSFDPHSALLVLHELFGMGYPGTILVIAGAAAGAIWNLRRGASREFWLLYAALPIVAALVADACFGYFLAIRQMLYVLPAFAVLFAAGVEACGNRKPALGMILAAVFFAGAVYANQRFFARARPTLPELQRELLSQNTTHLQAPHFKSRR